MKTLRIPSPNRDTKDAMMLSGGSSTDTREAVVLLSEKDKKIAELKRQLDSLRARNLGLENCVKNQDSAVRKIGSLIVSPRSTESSDVVTSDEIEDVIDDVYRKIRRMEDIDTELNGFAKGARKSGALHLRGELEIDGINGYTESSILSSDKGNTGKENQGSNEKGNRNRGFNDKVKRVEGDIFASERAFRQVAKDKHFDEKMLNFRLEQLRTERDTLYDILKQYEPILFQVGEDAAKKVEQRNGDQNHNPRRLEIEATVTLQNKGAQEKEKEELLYHIEELRKCLHDIKDYKSRKRGNRGEGPDAGSNEMSDKRGAKTNRTRRQVSENESDDNKAIELYTKYDIYERYKDGKDRSRKHEKPEGLLRDPVRNQPGYSSGKSSALGNLEQIRRISLTAEKPGVLIDSNVNEGNHVTRLFSNRIKELEDQEAENKKMIDILREELKSTSEAKAGVMKERDGLLNKVKEWVASLPEEKAKHDGLEDMVPMLDEYLQAMKEDLLKAKIDRDEVENQLWKAKNDLREEIQQKDDIEKELIAMKRKDIGNQEEIKRLDDRANESIKKVMELENSLEEEQEKVRDIETKANDFRETSKKETQRADVAESKLLVLEKDLEEEKENSSVFRTMLQEMEKAKKIAEKDIELIKMEYEKSIKNNNELKAVLKNEKEIFEELQKKQAIQDEELESMKGELNMTQKEMDDLRHRLKRKQEDLTAAELLRPRLEDEEYQNSQLQRRGNILENELSATKLKCRSVTERNDQLEGLLEKLKEDLGKANSAINELSELREVLKKSEDILKRDAAESRSAFDDSLRKNEELQRKLNLRNEELIKEQREKAEGRQEIHKANEELIQKDKELEAMQGQINEDYKEKEQLNAAITEARDEQKRLKEKAEEDNEALNAFEMELKSLKLLNETLDLEKKKLLDKLKTEEGKVSRLKESHTTLKKERNGLKEELEMTKQEVIENESMILEANKLLESKDERLKREEEKVKNLEGEIQDFEEDFKQLSDINEKMKLDEEILKKQLNMSQNEFKGLQKSLENSWKEKEDLRKAIEKLQTDNKEITDKIKILQEDVDKKEDNIKILKSRGIEKENEISELNEKVDNLKQELSKMKGDLKKKKDEKSHLEKRLSEKEEQLKTHRSKNSNLLENISLKNEEIDELREKIKDVTRSNEEQSNMIKSLRSSMERLKSRHDSELTEVRGKQELCQEYIQSLRNQVEGYKEREVKFQKNGNQMKEEFGKLTNELKQAKTILRDFQAALLDKDNDLKKINDAVLLLENAHATRQAGLQSRLLAQQNELEALNKECCALKKEILEKENDEATLKNEKEEIVERIRNDEKIMKHMQDENGYLLDSLRKIKKELIRGNETLGMKERQMEELNDRIAQDGQAVEELVEYLEGTLRNVRQQLAVVEDEKINLKALMDNDKLKLKELEDSLKEVKQELTQKDDDLMLEKAKAGDLEKRLRKKENETEDKKKIEELKSDLFKIGREKQAAVMRLTKERDEAILQKTAEKMAKDNIKLQMKNMKDEVDKLKKTKQEKDKEFDKYVEELKRRLVESREKEKEAVVKEADYRLKLKEMAETVRVLENRIEDAVYMAEEEKKRREEILAQLLMPLEETGTRKRDEMIDADNWKKRVGNLHRNIEDFKHQFSKFKSKTVADGEAYRGMFESKRSDEIHDLKRELELTKQDKVKMHDKLKQLNSEVDFLSEKKEKVAKDNSRLTEELRLAKQEALIQKHELDWLRDTIGKYGTQKKPIDII